MKKAKVVRFFILILFIIFAGFYIVSYSNYYDYDAKKRMTLTNEQIKQFEEDVQNGVDIDVKNYLSLNEKHYNNKVSQFTYKVSSLIGRTIEKTINGVFNKLAGVVSSN